MMGDDGVSWVDVGIAVAARVVEDLFAVLVKLVIIA